MKLRKLVSSAIVGAGVFVGAALAPREAHALGPLDLEIAARVGTATAPSDQVTNPYGVGLGARAGVSILGFYGGVSVIDYLGTSKNSFSEHAVLYGVEAGFGLKVAIVTIRPQIGVGNASFSASYDGPSFPGASAAFGGSSNHLYLEPGVVALISLGDTWFVGADVNALIVPNLESVSALGSSTTGASLAIHGQVGVRF